MSRVEERLDKVEQRLGSVEDGVNELRGEVGDLRGEVQKLRILGEQTASELKLMEEGHGARFDAITKALEPLARIDNFVRLVADDYEVRIKRLERHTGI